MNMIAPNAFASSPASSRMPQQGDARELSVIPIAHDSNAVLIPDAELLFQGVYTRRGPDLLLEGRDGKQMLVVDYFRQGHPADLVSPEGAVLPGAMAEKLAGTPTQLAQAGAPAAAQHIGRVTTLSGTASALRGTDSIPLAIGDQILLGDVVQTGDGSSLGITLADRTVFTMAARARMVLNELIYDPARTDNSFAATLVQGTFVFVTGQVAKSGTMQVTTPVATMGIRGTTPTVNIDANNGATLFGIAPDPGTGIVGSYTIIDLNTRNIIGTVSGITDRFRLGGVGQTIEVAPIIPQELLTTTQQVINLAYSTFNLSPPVGDPSLGGGPSGTPGSGTPPPGSTPPPSQAPTQDAPQAPPPIENRGQGPGGTQLASTLQYGAGTPLLAPTFLPDDPLLRGNNTPPVLVQERGVDPVGASITPISFSFSGLAATVEDTSIIISGFSFASAPTGSLTVSMSAGSTITLRSTAGLTFTPAGPDNDGVDDHSLSFTGSAADVLAALNGLTYTPTPDAESGGRLSITITDGRTTSSTQIGVDITATPDAPTQTATVYLISEDSTSIAGNFVTFDPDTGSSIAAAEILSGPSTGTLTLTGGSGFQWIPSTSYNSMTAGQTLDITFTARVQDNTGLWSPASQQTIRVYGVNDAPVVDIAYSAVSGDLIEDFFINMVEGNLTATDVDAGASLSWSLSGTASFDGTFYVQTGTYGTFYITDTGAWNYILNNADADTNALSSGQVVADTFTTLVSDGVGGTTMQAVTISIEGANDAPVVNVAGSTISGTLTEDNATTTLGGNLVATDVDAGASLSWNISGTANFNGLFYVQTGVYGTFYINSAGSWNYILDNADADTDALSSGQVVTDTFTAIVSDGVGSTATQTLTFTVNGATDTPTVNITNTQNEVALASIPRGDGATLVLYASLANASTSSLPSTIYGRVIDASGNVVGGEITFNLPDAPAGFSYENLKAAEVGGDIVIAVDAWNASTLDNFIQMSLFLSTGSIYGSTQLGSSNSTDAYYYLSDLDARPDGGFDVMSYKGMSGSYTVTRTEFNGTMQFQNEVTVFANSSMVNAFDSLQLVTSSNQRITAYAASTFSSAVNTPSINVLFSGQSTPYSMALAAAIGASLNLREAALAPDGSLLVLGEYEVSTPGNTTTTDNLVVFRITPAGVISTPVTITGPTGNSETDYIFPSDLLVLADGSFVIAYERQIGGVSEGLIRHYAENGTALTAEISLGFSGGQDGFPHLTQLANGSVLVTYSGTDSASDANGIDVYTYTFVPATASIITGTSASETLNGTSNADIMYGLAGNDTLYGNDGDDTLYGGDGNDIINAGAGNDTIDAGTNNGGLIDADTIIGSTGNDTITFANGGNGFFSLHYSAFSSINVTFSGNSGTIVKGGGAGTDTFLALGTMNGDTTGGIGLIGTAGNDYFSITAADANDFIHIRGGAGDDTIAAATFGSIRADYRDSTSGITVNLSHSTGQVINDGYGNTDTFISLSGGSAVAGIDELAGSFYTDSIIGSSGDDRFILNGGNDVLDGGAGFDRVNYARSGVAGLNVNLTTGQATGTWSGAAFTHSLTSIEWIRGSFGDDTITGLSTANETFDGRTGNDLFVYNGGVDTITDFVGGAGTSDRIDLRAYTSITNLAQLQANSFQSGANTVINVANGALTLNNVTLANLNADDFVFYSGGGSGGSNTAPILSPSSSSITVSKSALSNAFLTIFDPDAGQTLQFTSASISMSNNYNNPTVPENGRDLTTELSGLSTSNLSFSQYYFGHLGAGEQVQLNGSVQFTDGFAPQNQNFTLTIEGEGDHQWFVQGGSTIDVNTDGATGDTIRFDATGATSLSTFTAIHIVNFNTTDDKIDLDSMLDALSSAGNTSSFQAIYNAGSVALIVHDGFNSKQVATITGDSTVVSGATINVIDENGSTVPVNVT
jgi:VCBS repeat-containing protein